MCPRPYVSMSLCGQDFVVRILCVHNPMCPWPYVSRPNVSSPLCVQGSMWPSTDKIVTAKQQPQPTPATQTQNYMIEQKQRNKLRLSWAKLSKAGTEMGKIGWLLDES